MKETALATTSSFALVLPDKAEMEAVMQENMEGIDFKFDRIKIPSGGGTIWKLPDEDGNLKNNEELTGVIVDHYPVNAYWENEYTGEKNPPDCSALDAHTGTGNPGGKCLGCPNNQYGTAKKGNGKACKNIHRIYIIRPGEIFPIMLALPPSSLGNLSDYVRRLTSKLKPLTAVVTRITLDTDKSSTGIEYSKAVFAKTEELPKEDALKMAAHARILRPFLRQIAITEDEAVGGGVDQGNPAEDEW